MKSPLYDEEFIRHLEAQREFERVERDRAFFSMVEEALWEQDLDRKISALEAESSIKKHGGNDVAQFNPLNWRGTK